MRQSTPPIPRPATILLTAALAAAAALAAGCKSPKDSSGPESAGAEETRSEAPSGTKPGGATGESADQPACSPPSVQGVSAVDVVDGHRFESPTFVTQAPGDDETLYVLERPGRILLVRDGELLEEPFLDIRKRVGTRHQERGLLGIAFHPDYADNGRFFIYYTPRRAHENVVAEYRRASTDPPRASSKEVRRLVEFEDPEDNHNGGMLAFGPDGHLFVGMGDGGGAGDRHGEIGNGQNQETLLGSILRLDVDAPERDFAAEDNPFVDTKGSPQIWAWGLRNPWRFSFDKKTGDLYVGDVGQNEIEEIDFEPADSEGGRNYGWRAYEANDIYDEDLVDRVDEHAAPIATFRHGSSDSPIRGGCSVTGGYVYRGDEIDGLQGAYLYGDYCSKDVAAFRYCDGQVVGHRRIPGLTGLSRGLGSFGQGNDGELYLVYHGSGAVKRIVPE